MAGTQVGTFPSGARQQLSTNPEKQQEPVTTTTTTTTTTTFSSSPSPPLPPGPSLSRPQPPKASNTSAFRNVSACERCRKRKNRCDKRFPQCTLCFKAGVKCIGFDPVTGQQVPRSYVHHLETRCDYLERLLKRNAITFADSETFAFENVDDAPQPDLFSGDAGFSFDGIRSSLQASRQPLPADVISQQGSVHTDHNDLTNLLESVGMNSARGATSRNLTSASGISFTRICAAAVKSTTSGSSTNLNALAGKGGKATARTSLHADDSMRDSAFGLHTRPSSTPAAFPEKQLGLKLAELYFNYPYPQFPVLHRGQFMEMIENVYKPQYKRSSRENLLLNMVFAIGSGVFIDPDEVVNGGRQSQGEEVPHATSAHGGPTTNRRRMSTHQYQPEEYHAAAVLHLESFLGSCAPKEQGPFGGLEELQGILLMATYALLRPVAPGLWYIVGVAVRLALDLKLHHEDMSAHMNTNASKRENHGNEATSGNSHATWILDMRRRLFWCTYSLDRLVSSCVGRPYSIPDHMVSTNFPSILDDDFIHTEGLMSRGTSMPSPKLVSFHYFRLRLLQSEILHVLQHFTAQRATQSHEEINPYMHTHLQSPFLQDFASLQEWRRSMDKKLQDWRRDAPAQRQTGVQFSPLYWDLNYWQAILMLFRTSLVAPPELDGEAERIENEMSTPSLHVGSDSEERSDLVHLKIAQAGQEVIKLYVELHKQSLVNYTHLATHHLFMAGVSFLYVMWHSPDVRAQFSVAAVETTIQAAASVFTGLTAKCPPARTCRDSLMRIGNVTIKRMVLIPSTEHEAAGTSTPMITSLARAEETKEAAPKPDSVPCAHKRTPHFDTGFNELFTDVRDSTPSYGRLQQLPSSSQSSKIRQVDSQAVDASAAANEHGSSMQRHRSSSPTLSQRDFRGHPQALSLDWNDSGALTGSNAMLDGCNLEAMDIDPIMLGILGEGSDIGSRPTDDVFMGSDLPLDLLPGGEGGPGFDLLDQFWFGNATGDADDEL